jgi:hypothetical protein
MPRKKYIAQAGPGVRHEKGSDAGGNKEPMGSRKVWDHHMQDWVPSIKFPVKKARKSSKSKYA